jgi:hypothetical protein
MEKINWEAHGKALGAQINRRVHLTKLVHDCLPAYHRMNRDENVERECPGFKQADETRDHILRCSHPRYCEWHEQFQKVMNNFHVKAQTSPLLVTLWNESLKQWFNANGEEIQVSPILFPPDIRQVIVQQNQIGWRQMFQGRFAIAWAVIQDNFYARQQGSTEGQKQRRTRKQTGLRWQQKFIQEIWTQWTQLWKIRNDLVHGSSTKTQEDALRNQTTREVSQIYDHRDQLEPQTRQLLFSEVNGHLQRPSWVTRNWLIINASIFKETLSGVKKRAVAGVRSIRSYFAPTR